MCVCVCVCLSGGVSLCYEIGLNNVPKQSSLTNDQIYKTIILLIMGMR